MKSNLAKTVSLVTGAARGIGLAIADRLAANGSTVVYTDRDADQLGAMIFRLIQNPGSAPDCRSPDCRTA